MTTQSLHAFNSSLQAMPVALIFTRQLLLTQKSSVTVTAHADDRPADFHTVRATRLTTLLKEIPGFRHGGLND